MPRQLRQEDQPNLGAILQLYSMFSPDAQAKTQLLQQQVAQGPQLNQAQLEAIRAEIAQRTASTGLTQEQTRFVAPTAQAGIESQQAQAARERELTTFIAPQANASIARDEAGTRLSNAQTNEVSPNADLQRKLVNSEIAKNVIGIAPMVQDKATQAALISSGVGDIPGVSDAVTADAAKKDAMRKKLEEDIANLHKRPGQGPVTTPDPNTDVAQLEQTVQADKVGELGGRLASAKADLARTLESSGTAARKLSFAKEHQARIALLEAEIKRYGGLPADTTYRTEDFGLNQSPIALLRKLFGN